jgi:acetyltransferase-like isoleucine patch superfamily enzyme
MSLAGRTLLRVRQALESVPSAWRINRLRWREARNHQRLSIGVGTCFSVPVRSLGAGTLLIGVHNTFGFVPAPLIGNGEILLQPRAKEAQIVIGDHNGFSNNVSLIAMGKILMGNHCLIGDQVTIFDCDAHEINPQTRTRSAGPILPVIIGNNVWLGSRVMVLKGVTIGDNSVIAAMSVVTKPIPANCVAAGNPARIIRSIE